MGWFVPRGLIRAEGGRWRLLRKFIFFLGGPANSNMLSVRPDDKLTYCQRPNPKPASLNRKAAGSNAAPYTKLFKLAEPGSTAAKVLLQGLE